MSSTSPKRCPCNVIFCSKFSNIETILAASRFMPTTTTKIAWHEPNDMPSSSATSLIVIQRLSKIIFFTASSVVNVFGTSIFIDIFSAFLKSVIPRLNLCYAYSRLAELRSQHIKCPWTFNLIFYTKSIFSNSKKLKSPLKHD